MSKAQNPVMGQMTGSFANVNTYVRKGQNVISSKAFNRKDANTEQQKAHRAGFKLLSEFWTEMFGYADGNFPFRPARMSSYNYFFSLNMPDGIDSSGETPVINYETLQVAKGTLPGIDVNTAALSEAGLTLEIDTHADYPNSSAGDVITVIAKTKAGRMYVKQQERGTESTGSLVISMPSLTSDDMEFILVFVKSADKTNVSNSQFIKVEG